MSTRGKPFKACRKCRSLVDKKVEICPVCGSREFTEEWEGAIIVIDPGRSPVARELGLEAPGRYAIRVI
ncbi:MAG: DNA-directed RNA polymerase, subunit E'' [Thermogladius sp.]|nr:DNA-directed RNA polymerase, subunit E'' [Thermogladius sp.]